ncbi:MAG: DUF1080 domain-containing protein [Planctomycetota bacterium]
MYLAHRTLAAVAALAILGGHALAAEPSRQPDWVDLLDPELGRWEKWIGVPHTSTPIEWDGKADDVTSDGRPLGLGNDPLGVFECRVVGGEPVLFVSGQIYGGLTTLEEFGDYHLRLQFRWGEKKWPPRVGLKRDSGLLLHCVGEHGAFWNVWMRCLECQIQEGDVGDFFPLAGTAARVPSVTVPGFKRPRFEPTAPRQPAGIVGHGPSTEAPLGEWNTVDVYTIDDACVFAVNGVPNMVLHNTVQRTPDGDGWTPLTRGKLQIQSEGAEIQYRRIRLRAIEDWPDWLVAALPTLGA